MSDSVSKSFKQQKTPRVRVKWTTKEDNQLRRAISECGFEWLSIAQKLQNRNPNQCSQRWKKISGNYIQKKNFWTRAEDDKLLELIETYGKKWTLIERCLNGKRTSKQCRDRYLNKLDPNLKSQEFSEQEDQLIYEKYLIYGSKWSKIIEFLPGRSQNQIKNRFYTSVRTNFLNIKNPYFCKQSQEEARNELEQARKQHLDLIQNDSKIQLTFYDDSDELDFKSNNFDFPITFGKCTSQYSEVNFEF